MTTATAWIFISTQTLDLVNSNGELIARYPISTAANGCGEIKGSFKTPRGSHRVRAKIGENLPLFSVLQGRRPTGEFWSPSLNQANPNRDWILSRILWLCGEEVGLNRRGRVDSMQRYIYIHGTPETEPMGIAKSHGCIRLHNHAMKDLFDRSFVGMKVNILEHGFNQEKLPLALRAEWVDFKQAEIIAIRKTVFIEEQGVPLHLEWDEYDKSAQHLLIKSASGAAIACARLLRNGQIGRMAVLPLWRGRGVGTFMMQTILNSRPEIKIFSLCAQLHVQDFYRRLGAAAEGNWFLDAGIVHKNMKLCR